MQHCPNCSTEARDGAKFCTTCGFRFVEDGESGSWAGATSADKNAHGWNTSQSGDDESVHLEGWPSARQYEGSAGSRWDEAAAIEPAQDAEAASQPRDEYAGFWPESAADPWPSAATNSAAPNSDDGSMEEPDEDDSAEQETESRADENRSRARALMLIDQLRIVIESTPGQGPPDLSGVVSDLEVAVTPPGALPPDDVAELREALFAARERPRDVDTIVDLTKRIDALVSLVIAYERAIAAIERSLNVLKHSEQLEVTENLSPVGPGEGLA